MINRRTFIKRVLGIAALPVVGITKVLKSKSKPVIEVPVAWTRISHDWTLDELKTEIQKPARKTRIIHIDLGVNYMMTNKRTNG